MLDAEVQKRTGLSLFLKNSKCPDGTLEERNKQTNKQISYDKCYNKGMVIQRGSFATLGQQALDKTFM